MKPNILLFLTDQQRADTIAALGNSVIKTPSLDRLVRNGTAFTSAYSPSPVCVPARCSMHYGRYPGKTGCFHNADPMPENMPSFMQLLTEHGYRTHGIGKCHFTPERNDLRGFETRDTQEELPVRIEDDDYISFLQQTPYQYVRDPQGTRSEMVYMPQTSQLPAELHPTAWVADRSIDFLENQKENDRPWFLFCSFIHPHPPYAPPSPWDRLYHGPDMPDPHQPEGYEDLQPGCSRRDLYHYHLDGPVNMSLWQLIKARYYSCISFVDYNIGRIMERLEQTGQLENTLIIFTSDHGDMLGDLGLVGKCIMNEASVKVPLILSWSGNVDVNRKVDIPCSLVDVAATILHAAGAPVPEEMDGVDLLEMSEKQRVVLSQIGRGQQGEFMALDDRLKYVYSAFDQSEYLFDRKDDPLEESNLIDLPGNRQELQALKESLFNYLDQTRQTDLYDKTTGEWIDHSQHKPGRKRRNMRDNPWADYSIPGYN